MMIFLALYSRAQLLLSARKSPTKNSALLFSKRSQTSAFVVWREDRKTFPENDAFRMKDTHNTNNNNKQIPDKIPTAGKNV